MKPSAKNSARSQTHETLSEKKHSSPCRQGLPGYLSADLCTIPGQTQPIGDSCVCGRLCPRLHLLFRVGWNLLDLYIWAGLSIGFSFPPEMFPLLRQKFLGCPKSSKKLPVSVSHPIENQLKKKPTNINYIPPTMSKNSNQDKKPSSQERPHRADTNFTFAPEAQLRGGKKRQMTGP